MQKGVVLAFIIGIAMTTQGVWLKYIYDDINIATAVIGVSLITALTASCLLPFGWGDVSFDTFFRKDILLLTVGSGALGALIVGGLGKAIAMSHPSAAYTVIVAAQLGTTLFYEQFGIFGVNVRRITGWKILGIFLLVIGTFFVFAQDPIQRLKEYLL